MTVTVAGTIDDSDLSTYLSRLITDG